VLHSNNKGLTFNPQLLLFRDSFQVFISTL